MNFKIKSISLKRFKGIIDKTFDFKNCNKVSGANGLGKSTIACAFYWVMSDCDETLKSNPPVFNINGQESAPTVTIIGDVDGKPITISRTVKRTVKKAKRDGDADSVSFSSTYEVNSVEYGLRDFKAKLEEYGFSDNFLALAHPDTFLSSKKDDMRKVLFKMAQSKSDYEVACITPGAEKAAELLKDYKFDEVLAMQNATIRKVREVYGRDGEILRSRIEGLESAKVDLDWSALELQRNAIKEQIEKNQDAQRVANLILADLDKIKDKQLSLQFELSGIEQKAKAEKEALEKKLFIEKRELDEKATDLDRQIAHMKAEVQIYEDAFKHSEAEKQRLTEQLKQEQAKSFNENSLYCPTCNQLFKLDKQAEIRIEFNKQKLISMGNIENAIKSNRSLLAIKKSEKTDLDRRLEKAINDRAELQKALDKACSASEITINTYDDEISRLKAEIEKNKSVMDEKQSGLPNVSELKAEELNLNTQLRETEIQLSKADDNNRIDSQIEELRYQQIQYEQNKADSERILYQLDLVKRQKNTMLTDEINSHFKLVNWKLFDYAKNGEYKDVVIPQINSKDMGAALNNALIIRAKLDICVGLQNFYNEHYPIFLDNAESLDSENQALLDTDTQIIRLCVSDDKELMIKEA